MKIINRKKSGYLVSLLAISLATSGCGGAALKSEFRDVSENHASLSDEQMLLNLARRANSVPSHFLQMSGVNASFSFGATVGTQTTHTNTSMPLVAALASLATLATKVFSFTGTVGLSATESPTFSFAPLSGASFAKTAYTPVDSRIFFEQLRQGVPVNQLMRILVVSIVLDYPSGKRLVLNNIADQDQPKNFRNFLRLAGLARQMQLQQVLRIDTENGQNVLTIPPEALPLLEKLYSSHEYGFWEDSPFVLGVSDGIPKVSFVMRSFDGVLGALGLAQKHFERWLASGQNLQDVPETERRPILTLQWSEGAQLVDSGLEVEYNGNQYKIADLNDGGYVTWNRDSFRVLNDLFTIVSLDPKDMPVQQLIKVY
ncbi:hypothetical protein ACQE3E_19685 [Methylomonas sp. MED-D]|uniref:hypothetical protein n=1 Tax=Methylomonas TaxID=416 RepID=UPI000AE7A424|nr:MULTISPECIES: hypothetical protein [Methylomonas]MDT4332330.1 hypothetical protein [Methylomonas sp. MV1]NJA08165.1 hypothetical protein [Methylococcaceae bacterium WWC4]WGS85500.1 hypothetical protein QC632_21060 [Methylomonas sp. UP202]